MKRILIHHNFKRASIAAKDKLIQLLNDASFDIVTEDPDLIVSIGGDGTMLNAIRKHRDKDKPFIGINTGSLGFLPTIASDDIEKFIDVIVGRDFYYDEYPLLKVTGETSKGESVSGYAFNEIVMKQADPRVMKAVIDIDDRRFNHFVGDGLIISTAIGTSGYAIWAGGAAMHPSLKGVQMLPINPNGNAIYSPLTTPIIVPLESKIDITIDNPKYSAIVVGCDGVKLSKYAMRHITVSQYDKPVRILRCEAFNYFALYKEKIIEKKHVSEV